MRLRAQIAALRRVRRRKSRAGFTLVELMVVVVLISIITVIATPAMRRARDDRVAFDSARRIEQLIQRTRTRPLGRGAAHLFVASPSGPGGVRGRFLMFEALDGVAAPAGPNPISTCMKAGEWATVSAWAPGTVDNFARSIDGLDLNFTGINTDMNLQAVFSVNGVVAAVVVMCVQPGGNTYVGLGPDINAAITNMQAQTVNFNSFMEIDVTRNAGGAPIGLMRSVLVAGSAASRIKSQ